jgi:catechol 2,3-dioxygenase-like lactoylglutathione lyase family enzyme
MNTGILQLEHVALSVRDLDRSLAFYRDRMGFSVARIIEPREDPMLGAIVGIPNARARIAHLRLGDNMLELFQYVDPLGRPPPADHRQADIGLIHLGFRTQDARQDFDRLSSHGVSFISAPVEFRPGVWVAYFRGPDGEVCELRQDDHAPLPGGMGIGPSAENKKEGVTA